MSPVRHLNKAPVKEALIDCQFTGNWNRDFSDICAELAGKHGSVSDLFETSFTFSMAEKDGATTMAPSTNSSVGKRIDFSDARQVLQVKSSGFTFSQLEPYGSWAQVVADAKAMCSTLSSNLSDFRITRLGVRYINVIGLPVPFNDFNEYLTAAPYIPPDLAQGLAQFLIRTVSPVENDLVVVTQSLSHGEVHDGKVAIVLDIDVSCADIDQLTGTTWTQTLDRLRDRKNAVFFSYLTEKALEMYK